MRMDGAPCLEHVDRTQPFVAAGVALPVVLNEAVAAIVRSDRRGCRNMASRATRSASLMFFLCDALRERQRTAGLWEISYCFTGHHLLLLLEARREREQSLSQRCQEFTDDLQDIGAYDRNCH